MSGMRSKGGAILGSMVAGMKPMSKYEICRRSEHLTQAPSSFDLQHAALVHQQLSARMTIFLSITDPWIQQQLLERL